MMGLQSWASERWAFDGKGKAEHQASLVDCAGQPGDISGVFAVISSPSTVLETQDWGWRNTFTCFSISQHPSIVILGDFKHSYIYLPWLNGTP